MNGMISNPEQLAYIRRYTLENGLHMSEINNGVLRFIVNESRNADITQLWHKGTNISFLSKNGISTGTGAFAKRFEGGMLYTCGLDSAGGRDGFEVHGSLHLLPARVISSMCTESEIKLVTETRDTALFGKNLRLTRTFATSVCSGKLTVSDCLENLGTLDEDYCVLYHINLGYPMLDEGVTVSADEKSVTPRTAYAASKLESRDVFESCKPNEEESCYFVKHNTPVVTVTNKKLQKTLTLSYSDDTLPCFVRWNSSADGDYALGLEPSTTFLDDAFEYKKIGVGQKVCFEFSIDIK